MLQPSAPRKEKPGTPAPREGAGRPGPDDRILVRRQTVTPSLMRIPFWGALALSLAVLPAQADINWLDNGQNGNQSKDYQDGFQQGKRDCRKDPIDCRVSLEDVVTILGWGETEPNDNPGQADYLKPGIFYAGNTLDGNDQDWYFVDTTESNTNLVVSFIGDENSYTETDGWVIEIRDGLGNLLAAFDSAVTGNGNVTRSENDPVTLPKEPMTQARYVIHTLGNAGRYYIVVRTNDSDGGVGRAYHLAAMLADSRLVAPNPDTNFHDVETEPNDERTRADTIRSGVPMYGAFGRRMVKIEIPPTPPQYTINYYYVGCDPLKVATIPAGLDNCLCDLTSIDPATGKIQPPNPNTTSQDPADACYAKNEQVEGTGTDKSTWQAAYDYDEDWYLFEAEQSEQIRLELCSAGECNFTRVHVRVERAASRDLLVEGPMKPGEVFTFGVAKGGRYYVGLYPEPVNGPQVDPNTGVVTVDDLTGPYNFTLVSTGLPPQGGN